jgi:CBS domain-containing protein
MADAPAQHPAAPPASVADIMQPPVTAVEQNDHAAAAAYLMKRAGATALIVTKMQTGQPTGIITEADISRAVADGKNPNDVRIYELMTANPTVVNTTRRRPGRHRGHHRRMPRAARSRRVRAACRHRPGGVILAGLDSDGPAGQDVPACRRVLR